LKTPRSQTDPFATIAAIATIANHRNLDIGRAMGVSSNQRISHEAASLPEGAKGPEIFRPAKIEPRGESGAFTPHPRFLCNLFPKVPNYPENQTSGRQTSGRFRIVYN
jgi:hypothetical protein